MFDKRTSLEFKKILDCQKERVVKCDVKVSGDNDLTYIQTNESLKTGTHVDDNDLTNALISNNNKNKKIKK